MGSADNSWPLLSEHSGAFLRLRRVLSQKDGFCLCFLTFSDSAYRDKAAAYFAKHLRARTRVRIDPNEVIDTETLLYRLSDGEPSEPAQLTGLEHWSEGLDDLLARLNHRRDALAARCQRPLLFWVLADDVQTVATGAADLWAWRSGVFAFALPSMTSEPRLIPSGGTFVSGVDAAKRKTRMRELKDHLERNPPAHPADIGLLLELGDIQAYLGRWDSAKTTYQRAEHIASTLDDHRWRELAKVLAADVLVSQGKLEDALGTLEKALGVFEQLGDIREVAVTKARIADILQTRGELDEALRIRTEDEMPVYERLGDMRSAAVAKGKVADILQTRGELDEALRIRTEDQLPVYEQLGDVREAAITKGRIADILQVRGEFDEALRIRTEDELPVYERLGDMRSVAITRGSIADILQARGEFDEALRIRTENELPVYVRLGDVRSAAVTKGKIADIALRTHGDFDAALRIWGEEVLPVIERSGNLDEIAYVRGRVHDLRRRRS